MTQSTVTYATQKRGMAPLIALAAVAGPGLIAGLSDDDPAGITTYSVLGASYGYRLLWVLLVSTVALILFQDLGARAGMLSISALFLANIGTTTAEFAGIAAGGEIFGIPRWVSVPVGAIVVSLLVLRGGFRGVERVLLALSAIFLAYIGAGLLSKPDWGAAFQGLVTPSLPPTRNALLLATATLGTTLAPWGLAFIQSYAVDKKINPQQLKLLRVDVISGAVLTGVVGFFVVVSCAATLHRNGIPIDDASAAARALEPLADHLAAQLFAVGLVGAALLAASILPLSTAYSVCDVAGRPAALDDSIREAPLFYGTFGVVTVIGASLVLIPGISLVPILVGTQVLNAVLLLPLLFYMSGIAQSRALMGEYAVGRLTASSYWIVIALVMVSIGTLSVLSLT